MIDIGVRCAPAADGWSCVVRLGEDGRDVSEHTVTLSDADLARLAPDAAAPDELVERSFEFLLHREPPSSILRSFDLPVIGRYFPEYEQEIRGRP